MRSIHIKPTTN